MTPVDQRVIGEQGDCFTASLASLLDLTYEEVPLFIEMGNEWFLKFTEFIIAHGFDYNGLTNEKRINEGISNGVDGYFLVSGESPRGFKNGHAVVYKGTEIAHDPHPSRAGIIGEPKFWMIERIPMEDKL